MATNLETLLRRDRWVVLTALCTLSILAWAYILRLAVQMDMGRMNMTGFRMAASAAGMVMRPAFEPWSGPEFLFTLVMWTVMMIGMMTPSVAPIVLLYVLVGRQAVKTGKQFPSTAWFVGGYLLVWTVFSFVATTAQWALERAAVLTPSMATASALVGGIVLIVSGVYQWTSLKDKCLRQCQSPLQFIQRNGGFQRAPSGSLRLGVLHGMYCVGCCWPLMALLFVVGVMNVLWVALIAILILAEKVIQTGNLIPRSAGVFFVFIGLLLILRG
jgi:predicted metal-binding membrane protein